MKMERRSFIKNLCKTVAVASVVPSICTTLITDTPGLNGTTLTVPFKAKYFRKLVKSKFPTGEEITMVWNEMFDGVWPEHLMVHLEGDTYRYKTGEEIMKDIKEGVYPSPYEVPNYDISYLELDFSKT